MRNVFWTVKISFILEFYTLSNRRHFREARPLKTSAWVPFPGEMCPSKTREYNKTGKQNLEHRGSNVRKQSCELLDDFKEIRQENRHRAGPGKTLLYTRVGWQKAEEGCFQEKNGTNIFSRQKVFLIGM